MPVRYKQIEPAIVIVVKKTSAKAQHIMCGARNSRLVTHLIEEALAVIQPDVVGGQLKIRNVQIKPAIVIEVAQRDTHCGHHATLRSEGHAAERTNLLKSAIALVVVEISV